MRATWAAIPLLLLIACTQEDVPSAQSDEIESYTDELLRRDSESISITLSAALDALDVGPINDYDRFFALSELPIEIIESIKSLSFSLPPDTFPECRRRNPSFYHITVFSLDRQYRRYVDEGACDLNASAELPKPDEIVGILMRSEVEELVDQLLEFDPRKLNP